MSHIPDCRTDENYNEKYLDQFDKEFVDGYDYAVAQIINLISSNTDVYPELDEILDYKKAVALVDKKKILKDSIKDWAEIGRNELITSMIDSMDDSEYLRIKERIDASRERRSEKVDGQSSEENGEENL